jgi:hypothetical protein
VRAAAVGRIAQAPAADGKPIDEARRSIRSSCGSPTISPGGPRRRRRSAPARRRRTEARGLPGRGSRGGSRNLHDRTNLAA